MTVTITAPAGWVAGASSFFDSMTLFDYYGEDIYDFISAFLPGNYIIISDPNASSGNDADVTISDGAVPVTVRAVVPRPTTCAPLARRHPLWPRAVNPPTQWATLDYPVALARSHKL